MPSTLSSDIAGLLSDRMGLLAPSVDTDLFETGILDSLSLVELLIHIETTYGVTLNLSDIEIENFRSVESIAEFIERSGGGKSA